MNTTRVAILSVICFVAFTCSFSEIVLAGDGRDRAIDSLFAVNYYDEVLLSADGRWVALHSRRGPDVGWTIATADFSDPSRHYVLPEDAHSVRWQLTTARVSFFSDGQLLRLNAADGTSEVLHVPAGPSVTNGYEWSPDDSMFAYWAPAQTSKHSSSGVDVENWRHRETHQGALYIADISHNETTRLTPPDINVSSVSAFSWSPDSRRIAFTIDQESNSYGTNTDIAIADIASGAIRTIVSRAGRDESPLWSPTGELLAFSSDLGRETDYFPGWPAVVSTSGGPIKTFDGMDVRMRRALAWSSDADKFYFESPWRLRMPLFEASLQSGKVSAATETSERCVAEVSYSVADSSVAYLVSSITTSPSIQVQSLDRVGSTDLDGVAFSGVSAERMSWRSADGAQIHGILVRPSSQTRGRLPTVLLLVGGPQMVTCGFSDDGFGGVALALALRGYAVLMPNTRGRGGYGDDHLMGIRRSRSYLAVPFEDSISGIDTLVSRGIADASRLAVVGHSYGGSLAAFSISTTRRFRAAVLHDPGIPDLFRFFYPAPEGWQSLIARDVFGVTYPLTAADRNELLAQSPAYNLRKIHTPTLITVGSRETLQFQLPFYDGLRTQGVPSALIVYEDEHVFGNPHNVRDQLFRTLEWVDRWTK